MIVAQKPFFEFAEDVLQENVTVRIHVRFFHKQSEIRIGLYVAQKRSHIHIYSGFSSAYLRFISDNGTGLYP